MLFTYWIKEFWNDDFEKSLLDQGYSVKEPLPYDPEPQIKQAIGEIEEVLSSRRIGILKSVHLDKPTLPPLALTLTQTDQMLIFIVDEDDDDVHPKLMDFAVYHFGTKTKKFPSTVRPVFFNLISKDSDKSYLHPYVPKDNEFVTKHFDNPTVIKTTTKAIELLLDVSTLEELSYLTKLSPISSMEMATLLTESSGYWFSKVFNEARKRLKNFFVSKCPFCGNANVLHELPDYVNSNLNIDLKLDKENSYVAYCDAKRGGCGLGFIVVKDVFQGGVHGFFVGGEQQYSHELGNAKAKIQELGMDTHSFSHIKD